MMMYMGESGRRVTAHPRQFKGIVPAQITHFK